MVSEEEIGGIKGKGADTKLWLEKYPYASEERYEDLTEPWGKPLSTKVYFYSDHAHNQVTPCLVSGVISYVGSTPINCTSKSQGTMESSSYSAEFCAGQVSSKESISLWYMLRSI